MPHPQHSLPSMALKIHMDWPSRMVFKGIAYRIKGMLTQRISIILDLMFERFAVTICVFVSAY